MLFSYSRFPFVCTEMDCKDDEEYGEELCSGMKESMGCNSESIQQLMKNSCRKTCEFC